jgi:predicted nucleotidyltransferase
VLYGSYARGEETPTSDVDVMVVLEGEVDPWEELRRMSNAGYETSSAYEELVTLYPVSRGDFEHRSLSVLVQARREGIAV